MVKSSAVHSKTRVRRTVDEARRLILEAAERRLAAGGAEAVRVQSVAADVGVTDAAVHYHFGSRQGLLDAVVRSAGRRLRDGLQGAPLPRRLAPATDPSRQSPSEIPIHTLLWSRDQSLQATTDYCEYSK